MYNNCQLPNTESQAVLPKPISKHLFWQYYLICALFIKVADIQNSSLSGTVQLHSLHDACPAHKLNLTSCNAVDIVAAFNSDHGTR